MLWHGWTGVSGRPATLDVMLSRSPVKAGGTASWLRRHFSALALRLRNCRSGGVPPHPGPVPARPG